MDSPNNILKDFLSKFKELTDSQAEELADLLVVVEVRKNDTLVKEGQLCNLCYFVLKGCLRQYIVQEGVEKTINIYTEDQAVNYFSNQGDRQKSESFLTSLEDSVLLVGDPEKDIDIYSRFPALANITRKMLEADFGKTQYSLARMITTTPEQRYLDLMNDRPGLLQRVPQHIIASYLGITPESLSRIRKRIMLK